MAEFLSSDPAVQDAHPHTVYDLIANICHDGQPGIYHNWRDEWESECPSPDSSLVVLAPVILQVIINWSREGLLGGGLFPPPTSIFDRFYAIHNPEDLRNLVTPGGVMRCPMKQLKALFCTAFHVCISSLKRSQISAFTAHRLEYLGLMNAKFVN